MNPSPRRRVVVVGAAGGHRTEAAIARAVGQLGHACLPVDAPRWRRLGRLGAGLLRRRLARFQPDAVILTRYASDLDDRTLAELGRLPISAVWFFDLLDRPHPAMLRLARAAGTLYVTCPDQIPIYRAAGVTEVQWLPQGVDPVEDRPADSVPAALRCEVSFVGSGQYGYRHALLRAVAARFDLQIRGPGWPPDAGLPIAGGAVRGAALRQVIGGAAISLGANATEAQWTSPRCASNRMWHVLGAGGFYLGPRVPGIELLARGGEHCAWYGDDAEALELIAHYLERPEERARIAAAGRAHALAEHSYRNRVERILAGAAAPLADEPQTKR